MRTEALTITRRFEIDAGHRLIRHESKCRNLHGHRYAFEFELQAAVRLDEVGRIMDFAAVKDRIGAVLDELDHACILQEGDALIPVIRKEKLKLVVVAFPPTIEHLVQDVAARVIEVLPVPLVRVRGFETPNCWAEYVLP